MEKSMRGFDKLNWKAAGIIAFIAFSFIASIGCAARPRPLSSQELFRKKLADVKSIGIVTTHDIPEVNLSIPAKGSLDGAKKGALEAGQVPLHICENGIDEKSLEACLVLTPIFGAVGSVVGAITADKAAIVNEREAAVRKTVSEMQVQEKMNAAFRKAAELVAPFKFENIDYPDPAQPRASRDYRYLKNSGVDLIQEMTITEFGLTGNQAFRPNLSAYMVLLVRMVRPEDNYVVFGQDFTCTRKKHPFKAWAENGGEMMRNELDACYGHLAEDAIKTIYSTSLNQKRP